MRIERTSREPVHTTGAIAEVAAEESTAAVARVRTQSARNVLLLALGLLAILHPYHQNGLAAPGYGAWSGTANLGSFVNTEFAESGPHTSKDGRATDPRTILLTSSMRCLSACRRE